MRSDTASTTPAAYTATGALRDWWQAQDVAAYAARVQPVLDQLSLAAERRSNPQADGHRLNGMQVLAESVGDVAGLSVAHRAYRMSLGGQARAGHRRAHGRSAFLSGLGAHLAGEGSAGVPPAVVADEPYAPADFRANGTAGHLDAFYRAFGVSAGDALFVPPARRARLY